jgi:hypothetical protein
MGFRVLALVAVIAVGCSSSQASVVDASSPDAGDDAADADANICLTDPGPTVLAPALLGNGIAVDATDVYFVDVDVCPSDGGACSGAIKKVPLEGGSVTTLAWGRRRRSASQSMPRPFIGRTAIPWHLVAP